MAPAPKSSKKRPASSQAGPKAKKANTAKGTKESSPTKRSKPVTVPQEPDSASGSDSEEDWEDVSSEEEAQAQPMDEDADEYAMDESEDVPEGGEDAQPKVPKDPNASRDGHKAQKVVQEQRKAAKPHSDLLTEAKLVWAPARQKNITSAERQKHIEALMKVIRGKVKDIVFKHDASRIVQTVVKHGKQKDRDEIAVELKGKYKELAQNKYSKFLITKLIRFCPTHRASILTEFQSSVLRLLLHREASSVLADAFELYANAYERSILLREFYGKEATLFTITSGTEDEKQKSRKGLVGLLEGIDGDRKKRVLTALKENLETIFNNPDKGAITHAIVHRALWEYLNTVNTLPDEAEQEKLRREAFENCQEALAEMVHTRDGSRVVREFIARGSAKDRKQILKVLKPHIERMCLDDEAQTVLFTAFDVIDDTKLLSKTIVPEITGAASKLYSTTQGRRSLLYLIVPRTTRHFTPAQIASLAETDSIREKTSKKDPEARQEEILKSASSALLEWIAKDGASLVREPAGALIVTDVMLYADGDKSEAISTLLTPFSSHYPSTSSDPHPIDLPHTSRAYKTLLQGGHFNHRTKSVTPSPAWDATAFAVALVETVDKGVCVNACTKGETGGLFLMAELCTALVNAKDDKAVDAREDIKKWFSGDVRKEIEAGEARGKKALLEQLDRL
ncbi:puf family RNA-binding protein [Cyathus striatus]|nr:puf family RNA-binding protein [Cyathus striatus]